MKGVVFTEFIEMVEARFSADLADDIIEACQLPSGGAYTAVGTYDHEEMAALLGALSARTGQTVPALLTAFGEHLFPRFVQAYPVFFRDVDDAFAFMAGIETIIHAEVRKLYPDAQLPRFDLVHRDAGRLVFDYRSSRHLEDLAEGLILGCLAYFRCAAQVSRAPSGDAVRFTVVRH